jgi:peptidoglycan/LPS O-acetylase OafA/YrhL
MPVLDGSRGFAALFVVLVHSLMTYRFVPLAHVAVDYFFVLSGLVLAHAYGERLRSGSMTFGRFFAIRFVRLYPMIALGMVMGAVCFLVTQWMWPEGVHPERFLMALGAGLLLVPLPAGFLLSSIDYIYPLCLQAWSLLFEVISNLVYAPLVPYLTMPRLLAFQALCGAAYACSLWIHRHSTLGVTLDYFPDGLLRVAYSFTAGLVIHRLMRPGLRVGMKALPVLMMLFAAICTAPVTWGSNRSLCLYLSSVLVVMPALVFLAAHMHPGPRITAACSFLGRLSYPLYMAHFPVIYLFNQTLRNVPLYGKHLIAFVCLQFLCALAAGVLAMRLFDEPLRAWLGSRLLLGRTSGSVPVPPIGSEAH